MEWIREGMGPQHITNHRGIKRFSIFYRAGSPSISFHSIICFHSFKKLNLMELNKYYNSTCFIDHIFLKGYHPSINQHLITVIIMNGVKQSSNFSTMNEIQSTFWLNGMVCWFVWWWLMEWLCCPFTQLRWLRVVSYRFSFQHQLQSTINQTNQFISLC